MKNRIILIVSLIAASICGKAQTNENIFLMNLGDSKVYLLSEGQRDGSTEILIGAKPEIIDKHAPNKSFPMATNVFLWQTDGKNILFDAGYGKLLFDNLQFLKVNSEEIDAIYITHMHGDHFGGLLRDGNVAFPTAVLYLSQAEYDYWTDDELFNKMPENRRGGILSVKNVLEAYKEQLCLFEPNTINSIDSVSFGIQAIACYGHTPGHTAYFLESGNDKLLIWGDLTHAMAIQMPYPKIAVTYDTHSENAIQSRSAILQWVSEQAIPVAGMHIAYPGIGTIEKSKAGYRFIPHPKIP